MFKIHLNLNKNIVNNYSDIYQLYKKPLPSTRSGALFNAFPYPTKISPEAIALFIACHTKIGDTILDPFAGSGTTGLAGLLCDCPTDKMKQTAIKLGLKPKWGARKIILQELSSLGAFIGRTMCKPPPPAEFTKHVSALLDDVEHELNLLYRIKDETGSIGQIRYVIWSDLLKCPSCQTEVSFWDAAVQLTPLKILSHFKCQRCNQEAKMSDIERVTETKFDIILNKKVLQKKRIPIKVYGKTGKKVWNRYINSEDIPFVSELLNPLVIPQLEVNWGDLYRKGYHKGINYIHQFYTERNLIAFSSLWDKIKTLPKHLQEPAKLLILSYNTAHATLMSRVVVKKKNTDFALTGAQSGVLYISSLPVEKNIFHGIRRKIKTFKQAFELVHKSTSSVEVINASSTCLKVADKSVDYIFTDPPFGGYIPYSEINQINEAWLGTMTEQKEEVIVSNAQNKTELDYAQLMQSVFTEMYRTLKDEGKTTVVFHSAKASIWKALMTAYSKAGFKIRTSSILDKAQGSFKQVNSNVKVQGDPLLLLEKEEKKKINGEIKNGNSPKNIILKLLKNASLPASPREERTPERLYSRFVAQCLEKNIDVPMNAEDFYRHIKHVGKHVLA